MPQKAAINTLSEVKKKCTAKGINSNGTLDQLLERLSHNERAEKASAEWIKNNSQTNAILAIRTPIRKDEDMKDDAKRALQHELDVDKLLVYCGTGIGAPTTVCNQLGVKFSDLPSRESLLEQKISELEAEKVSDGNTIASLQG